MEAAVPNTFSIRFNTGFQTEGARYPHLTWIGQLDLYGGSYAIAWSPTENWMDGEILRFKEDYWIYPYDEASPFFEFTGGVLTRFEPGPAVLEGSDEGFLDESKRFEIEGTIATARAPLTELAGRSIRFTGSAVDDVTGTATCKIL